MNRLQAIAKIMAMLIEDGRIKPGSREYKIARRIASRKIERLGPDGALAQTIHRHAEMMRQVEMVIALEDSGATMPRTDW
ncbi:MAG: hypothetical protein PVG51_18760 [Desulfosarcina sp.]|jgi:hypothetical protein